MANVWTATTSTAWIHFKPEKDFSEADKRKEGSITENITIYLDEATTPNDDEVGSITIKTDNGTSTRTVKRCLPTVTGQSTKTLKVKINGSDNPPQEIDPCGDDAGAASQASSVLKVTYAKVTKITPLSTDPNYVEFEKEFTDESDINANFNITYSINEGGQVQTYTMLPTNTGKTRQVTVTVVYKSDSEYKTSFTVNQKGYLLDNGDADPSAIDQTTTGLVGTYYTYTFDISPKSVSGLCSGGTQTYSLSNPKTVEHYGGYSGITICGKSYTWGSSGESIRDGIDASLVKYSLDDSSLGYFEGNVLHYYKNEDNNYSKVINVSATVKDTANNFEETKYGTYVVFSGCGPKYYVHIAIVSDLGYVPYAGGSVVVKYYLSKSANDDENLAENVESVTFGCPSGIQNCGNSTESRNNKGVYTRTVTFGTNPLGSEGKTWEFTATCSVSQNVTATAKIYQANDHEHIIADCHYFVFSYDWLDSDGTDLDSLTVINNVPALLDNRGNSVTGDTVGYGATSGYKVDGQNNVLYLKHGGDNRCNGGAEGAIICLKNIIDNGTSLGQITINDIIYVDIYACWFVDKFNGNMSVKFRQFKGSGNYSEDIVEEELYCDRSGTYYKTFNPSPTAINVTTNDNGEIVDYIETERRYVNAAGTYNYKLAKKMECLAAGAYTHVLRLVYNVATEITSLETFGDDGINTKLLKLYVWHKYQNEEPAKGSYPEYTVDESSHNISIDNIYFEDNIEDNNVVSASETRYLFTEPSEYLRFIVYNKNGTDTKQEEVVTIKSGNTTGTLDVSVSGFTSSSTPGYTAQTTSTIGTVIQLADIKILRNIKVTVHSDKTVKVEYELPSLESEFTERKVDNEYNYHSKLLLNGCTTIESRKDINVVQKRS